MVVGCLWFVACRLLIALFVVCCPLFVVCGLFVVCCSLYVVCYLVCSSLIVVRCVLLVARWSLRVRCSLLSVICYGLIVVRCVLGGVWGYVLFVGLFSLCVFGCLFSVGCCYSLLLFVVRCLLVVFVVFVV